MKTCLIYGHNGLDLDVTFNLVRFYKELDFKVFFSEKLYDADLLVVVRAIDKEIELSKFNFQQVHVFDYGGWDYDGFIRSIEFNKTIIFTTSGAKRERIISTLKFPAKNIHIAFPPVITDFWAKKRKKVIFDTVHIGNFKPLKEEDECKKNFDKSIGFLSSDIWGLGWEGKVEETKYHGKCKLLNVSKIYSSSKFALGLMYPFQRMVTFSGRFWHAPLNGCFLISEPGIYTSKIPGIIETNYTSKDITQKLSRDYDHDKLILEAKQFWDNEKEKTKKITVDFLKDIGKSNNKSRSTIVLNYYREKWINRLRYLYQMI